jgi:hypothetical protein
VCRTQRSGDLVRVLARGRAGVKCRIGLKRTLSCADGLTRVQAEQTMRRFMGEAVAPPGQRYTVAETGAIYIEHLEVVM